jgi:acyl-CoA synthetase (AMP-forming)/AMP-acid ligase II
VADTEVRIASPSAARTFLGAETAGEVLVRGPGLFAGYFNDAAATAEALRDGWLHTGDLGFIKDGELYITGRIKDLLIIHGHNLMPHELEQLAEAASGGGGTQRCAAFSILKDEGEQAVLVVEVNPAAGAEWPAVEHEIRSRIGRALGLTLAEVVFVKRGQIPKTTSGKIRRGELRQRYLDGLLDRIVR